MTSASPRAPTTSCRWQPPCCASPRSRPPPRSSRSGRHSLLEPVNARVIEAAGLPFTVHGPFAHFEFGSRSASKHRGAIDLHRRHMWVAAELGALLVRRPPRHAAPGAGVEPEDRRFSGARLRGAQRTPGRDRPVHRRGEHAVLQALAFHRPRRPRPQGARPGPRRRPRRRHRDARHLAERPAGGPPARASARQPGSCAAATTTIPWARASSISSRSSKSARAAGASIVLEHKDEVSVLASLDHLRTRGLLVPDPWLGGGRERTPLRDRTCRRARALPRASRALRRAGSRRARARRRRRQGAARRGGRGGHGRERAARHASLRRARRHHGTAAQAGPGGRPHQRRDLRPPDPAHRSGPGVHGAGAHRLQPRTASPRTSPSSC